MLLKITFDLKCLVAVSETLNIAFMTSFLKVSPHISNVGLKNLYWLAFSQIKERGRFKKKVLLLLTVQYSPHGVRKKLGLSQL
jgi:hypothetical protein